MADITDPLLRKIYADLHYSASKLHTLFKEIKKDFEFAQGKQWSKEDTERLRKQGVKALSINKIKPIIKLITGIERQSKSDYKALPEGDEDAIKSEVVTRLLKNIVKQSKADLKMSEEFKHGAIGGISYLEPYIDYSFDLINGEMKFKLVDATNVYFDPDFKEYDMSDSRFLIKVTKDLTKDELIGLFPDEEKKIEDINGGKLQLSANFVEEHFQLRDYPALGTGSERVDGQNPVRTYDLIDYYEKRLEKKYFIADPERGVLKETDTKAQAEEVAAKIPTAQVVSRKMPVIYLVQAVGDKVLSNEKAWTYPAWKSFPLIPFFFERVDADIDDISLKYQGIVRATKDLQEEFNKRRTQELRHLNASTNSGWLVPKGALDAKNANKMKEFGSSPGVVIEYDAVRGEPKKQFPSQLSQGHVQLAEENHEDLKEASGVNPDLLANQSQSQSGRAILLKQRQGLVMVQESLDNFAETKKIAGRFIVSQLKEVFTVETAMKVLGDAYIQENFTVPVQTVINRGLEKMQKGEEVTELEKGTMLQYPAASSDNPAQDEAGLAMMVDIDSAILLINEILTDPTITKYDISIGEGAFAETIKMSNFLELTDLAKQGYPIPPSVLIEQSMIAEADKKQIIEQIALAQQQQAQLEAQGQQQGE
jgi:hypothetical protein